MEKTIEELRAELRAMEEAERKHGQAEYEAIRNAATFDWRLTLEPFGFCVECRYDVKTREAMTAWREAFPKAQVVNLRDPEQWHGMSYILGYTRDGEPFLHSSGGGALILKRETSFGPFCITAEQAAQFEAGEIPEELKKPW